MDDYIAFQSITVHLNHLAVIQLSLVCPLGNAIGVAKHPDEKMRPLK